MTLVLYYDRDPAWLEQARRSLSRGGSIAVAPAGTFADAASLLGVQGFDAVVADPLDEEVLALLSLVRAEKGPIPFVLCMGPGHERIVIDAFNSGMDRYIEKSGDPEARLDALRTTIHRLVQQEPGDALLQRQFESLEFLSRTAMDFIRMEDDQDIYRYIGEQVYGLVPESHVLLFAVDPESRRMVVRAILPEEPASRVAREEFGRDLVGHTMSLDNAPASLIEATLECNQMMEGVTSAYYGFLKTLPEEACERLEQRLDLGKYYSMGCTCRGGLYGVITVAARKGTELENRELVEAFVRQASVALLRRQARQKLAESDARYRAVVESQQELVCRFRPDGTHLVANEAYCRFFNLDPATVAGTHFAPDVPEGERTALRDYFRGFSPARPDGMIEHRAILPDGSIRWLHWSDRAFFGRNGTIKEFQSVGRDVTDRKEAEAALAVLTVELEERVETATADLRAANRDLEAFSHHVSHDLRAPLRAIDGYLGILMHRFGSGLDAEAAALIGRARDGVSQANRFLEGLLSLSRLSHRPLNLEVVEPGPIVQAVLEELLPDQAARHVEVTVSPLPPCRADPEMLRHVWQNLVSNAVKFTRTRDPARIAIDATGESDVVYSVRDNGVGFPPGEADRVFDDFARLHDARVYEGSGIGLSLVRRIVERHGGRVWADGDVDRGAAFHFTLGGSV